MVVRMVTRRGGIPPPSFAFLDTLVSSLGYTMVSKDATMTLRHFANQTSGYALPEDPGTTYAYNDYAIALYADCLRRHFDGSTSPPSTALDTAYQSRLHSPLGLQDGAGFTVRSGRGLSLSPRDFCRIGWLWANRGNWNGSQILPDAWFDLFGEVQVPDDIDTSADTTADDYLSVGTFGGGVNDTQLGPGAYGFNLWLNGMVGAQRQWPDAPTDTMVCNGHAGNKVLIVIPSLDMVVAVHSTSSTSPGICGDPKPAGTGEFNTNLAHLADAVTGAGSVASTFPGASWATATDAEAGLATAELDAFIAAVGSRGIITRHGYSVRTWGTQTTASDWASAAKPVLSTMLGFAAVEEG